MMNDYSDLVFLMGAMILFSLLTINVSRNIVANSKNLSKSEIEYNGIALAQSIIEQGHWATKSELDPTSGDFIFKNFEKSHPHKETLQLGSSGQYKVDYYIYAQVDDVTVSGSSTTNKKITVGVTSPFFYENFDPSFNTYPIKMAFINSFEN